MFSKLISAVLLTALAGRALAFNVTINKDLFQANEILKYTFTPVIASCQAQCDQARTTIDACGADDLSCYCAPATTGPLQTCEQCIFTALVVANKPPPDIRAGSNQILAGWNSNCNGTVKPPLAVTLPASWDGPFVAVFPDAVGWVIAATGGLLGSSLIYMLCNM
ncbi:hypothetical protein B0H15DRAFT_956955 [Mycena belliarum]|uniref:Extracellular membrane protein CFEM domain-containing protein n=1 Tax=Mycena belliarum TaxID=1033014 RepID=A0AAD6TNP3_9AGAR|nr:hypothetical protein B0H15DRAFT_956955 [Mycena belliae]